MNTLSVDPYFPRSYKDLVGNGAIFREWADIVHKHVPTHVLWQGPQGIGKTTFWKLVVPKEHLLIINCYADSGLRDQRDSIKHFIRLSGGQKTSNKQLRYILFEHAEVLGEDAQAFLRRMLEIYSNTIFCIFEVRDSTAITEPIMSRCRSVQLSPLQDYEMKYELARRLPQQPSSVIAKIVTLAGGNMRWALLQGFASTSGFTEDELGLNPTAPISSDLLSLVTWEEEMHDNGYDPRVTLSSVLPKNKMEVWRRIMETPGGVHTRSQTILLALNALRVKNSLKEEKDI